MRASTRAAERRFTYSQERNDLPLHQLVPLSPPFVAHHVFLMPSTALSLFDFATSFLCHLRSQLPMKSIGAMNGGGCGSRLVVAVHSGSDRIAPAAIVLLRHLKDLVPTQSVLYQGYA